MAIYGLKKILVPEQRLSQLDDLFQRNGMTLHPLYDATEGDVLVLRMTGTQPADKRLYDH